MTAPNLRQVLAVVFCDIAGTTQVFAREGDLVASTVLRDFYEHSGRLATEHGATFIKFIGDGFLAVFADIANVLPFARSVAAMSTLRERGLECRFSLHLGDVLCIETSYGKDIFGESVNLVARLESLAHLSEIVVTQAALDRMPTEQQALAGPVETGHVRSAGEVTIRRITLAAA